MFYIDIWEGRIADWVPIFGGDYMALWPVFNVADASIFLGITFILIFQKKFFPKDQEEEKKGKATSSTASGDELEKESA